jgi:hypothetical protein
MNAQLGSMRLIVPMRSMPRSKEATRPTPWPFLGAHTAPPLDRRSVSSTPLARRQGRLRVAATVSAGDENGSSIGAALPSPATREGDMPGKTPQKHSAKKAGKSLKEKRDVKKAKKADRKTMPG